MNPEFDPLKNWKISPPRESAQRQALEESLRALRHARAETKRPPGFSPGWFLALGGAAALILAAAIFLRPASRDSLDSAMLAEFQALFGPALNALVERNGGIEVITSNNPPAERGQPILIKAQTAFGSLEIVGFSGSRFELELNGERVDIEPLVNADGSILLCGENFIWGKKMKAGTLPSMLKTLRAEPLTPAT